MTQRDRTGGSEPSCRHGIILWFLDGVCLCIWHGWLQPTFQLVCNVLNDSHAFRSIHVSCVDKLVGEAVVTIMVMMVSPGGDNLFELQTPGGSV